VVVNEPEASEAPEPQVGERTLDDRVGTVEQLLAAQYGLGQHEAERQEHLEQMQVMADQAHQLPPDVVLGGMFRYAHDKTRELMGSPLTASPEDFTAAANALVRDAVPDLESLAPAIQSAIEANPAWLTASTANPGNPAVLAEDVARVAGVVRGRLQAAEEMRETKRWATTVSGASNRPQTMTAEEAAWARIKAAGSGGYGG
jgi:hypothetical protein